ncbi:MAG: hypothetical protein MI974_29545 [Chitinophagales bacterium]|nr:hypothetical protein [Chitinophagales bacterium]
MNQQEQLFYNILQRNGFVVKKTPEGLHIKKGNINQSSLWIYAILLAIAATAGFFIAMYISRRLGYFIIAIGAFPAFALINIKQREVDNKERSVTISNNEIGIKHRYKLFRIPMDEFHSFDVKIKETSQVLIGSIYIKTIHQRSYEFLELFNSDPQFIASDIKKITSYLQEFIQTNQAE